MVSGLQAEIVKATASMTNPLLIFSLLDNTYFQTSQEDGSIIPHSRRADGSYHVDGDLICGPSESAKKNFLQLVPLFQSLVEMVKVLTVPLPRYLWRACCNDDDHVPNTRQDGYLDYQREDLDGCHRLWKGLAHREKLRNIKICNTSQLLFSRDMWLDDPVHPRQEAYDSVAKYLVRGVLDLEEKRKTMIEEPEQHQPAKRPRTDAAQTGQLNQPPLYRPAWMSNTGNFVSPSIPRPPFFRGRGRGYRGGFHPFY
jgi:hypothetical protein